MRLWRCQLGLYCGDSVVICGDFESLSGMGGIRVKHCREKSKAARLYQAHVLQALLGPIRRYIGKSIHKCIG